MCSKAFHRGFLLYILYLSFFTFPVSAQTAITKTADDIHWDAINRHRDQIERGGNISHDYATCGTIFPLEISRSKEIVLSGYIKTADLTDGYAGFWWHVDRRKNIYDIRDMSRAGCSGTAEWAPFRIAIQVKKDAVGMDFGCVMSGNGKAWFDDLTIEIDGISYSEYATLMSIPKESLPFLNLDFEKLSADKKPAVWSTHGGDNYVVRVDSNVKHSGRYSLMIGLKSLEPNQPVTIPHPVDTIPKPVETVKIVAPPPVIPQDTVKMHLSRGSSSSSGWILYIETRQKINVNIFSSDKKVLLHKDNSKAIDISALANGVYNVEIYNEEGHLIKSSKLVKEVEQ